MRLAQQFTAGMQSNGNTGSPVGTTERGGRVVKPWGALSRPYGTYACDRACGPSVETLGNSHIVPPGHGPRRRRAECLQRPASPPAGPGLARPGNGLRGRRPLHLRQSGARIGRPKPV